MCGRYALRQAGIDAIGDDFHIRASDYPDLTTLAPRYNAAPMQDLPVVAINKEGVRKLRPMRWGFLPGWAKEKPKVRPINARADTVATSGLFRTAFARRRCLVPADGWYEWRAEGGPKKQPYLFEVDGGRLFAFAGIWDVWREAPDADPVFGFATITTAPNKVAAAVHDRMPVILPAESWDRWLDPAFQDPAALLAMLPPLADAAVTYRPVNPAMGNVRFEGPACVEPPPAASTALASDAPLKTTRTRKPRAKKTEAGEADLFTAN
ncbi:MAG TPA: SOS response-associated peptidase [Gemmataceae bacterium]|nr:SOS response-associated peptidase [Gemmataceae bacterium]